MFENVDVADLLGAVRGHAFDPHDDVMGAHRIDAIKACDLVIRAAQAAQAEQISALNDLRASQITLGRGNHSLSVIGELGMARNVSPSSAGSHYGFAIGLARMPRVAEVFATGGISEQAARLVVRESTGLDLDQVTRLDQKLAPRIPGLTARKAGDLARHFTIGIDAQAAYERAKANRADRFVSLFPDTDGVAVLQVRGPAELMLAAYNALDHAAKTAKTAGDPRTRGQVMCDEFVQRATGLKKVTAVNVEIGLVMTVGSLLRRDQLPAMLAGFGPIPSELAHNIVAASQQTWVRRLFSDPIDGTLIDTDQRRRRFTAKIARLIADRDRTCRQPGCDCRIREFDHIVAHQSGGLTTGDNGQGLCTRSHTLKHQPGWKVGVQGRDIGWTTPTGHTYHSKRPPIIEYTNQAPGHQRQ